MATRRTSAGRAPLTKATIVEGAFALAESDGLDAVTIRRLTRQHGVTPMALYAHFKDKDQLFDAMAESLLNAVPVPQRGIDQDWAAHLRDLMHAFVQTLRRHPAVACLTARSVLDSAPGLQIVDRMLSLLHEAGLSRRLAADLGQYLLAALVALVTSAPAPLDEADAETYLQHARTRRLRLASLPPQQYPAVVASSHTLGMLADAETYYTLGIDLLVNGVAATAARSVAHAAVSQVQVTSST